MSLETACSTDVDSNIDADHRPSWILGLPDELLALMLVALADMEPPTWIKCFTVPYRPKPPRDNVLGWMRLSEVCTRFRALLLSMATLWASAVFDLPLGPGKLSLTRSKSAPLQMRIRISHKPYKLKHDAPDLVRDHLISVAVEHATRMRLLSYKRASLSILQQLFSVPLLKLNVLDINCDRHSPVDLLQDVDKISVDAPIVQEAHFEISSKPVHSPFGRAFVFRFPSLLSLEIRTNDDDGHDMHAASWITGILETSPLLENFTLFMIPSGGFVEWGTLFNSRSVTLAHLRSLNLFGNDAVNILELYSHIGLPRPPVRCSVGSYHPFRGTTDRAKFSSNLTHTFNPLFWKSSRSGLTIEIEVETRNTRVLRLQMFPAFEDPRRCIDLIIGRVLARDVMKVTVDLGLPTSDPLCTHVADIVKRALHGNTVTQLCISAPGLERWPAAISAVVSACPAVTELVVDYTFVKSHYDTERMRSDIPIPTTENIFPELDSVFLKPQIAHGEYGDDGDADFAAADSKQCIEWLASRTRAGLRVRRLCIFGDMNAGRKMYARAAEFVDEFTDERV